MSERVRIVAEAAQGFQGSPDLAKLLVRAAAEGHADVVKFQLVYADELATPDYQYYPLFKQLEMSDGDWGDVAADAKAAGLRLAFDVFGMRSLDAALALGAAAVKIHASDFFNETLTSAALARAPEVLLSAGGITVDEIAAFVKSAGARARSITLMYGFQAEPTETADNHLRRLQSLAERFPGLKLGFMDHSAGDSDEAGWLGALALPLGATVVEKHITLDRALALEDYVSALAPADFRRYVERIRAAQTALGSPGTDLSAAERAYRGRAVKSVVTTRGLTAGGVIQAGDVALLRASGAAPARPFHRIADIAGRTLARDVAAWRPLEPEDLR